MGPLRGYCPAVPRPVLHLELHHLLTEFIDVVSFGHQDSLLASVSHSE